MTTVPSAVGLRQPRARIQPTTRAMRNGAATFSVAETNDPLSWWLRRPRMTNNTTQATSIRNETTASLDVGRTVPLEFI